jgi:SOS-response transcriptional repressor LexA
MTNHLDVELFELIKSTIIKSNLGIYVSRDKALIVENLSQTNPELYNNAVNSAMIEINKGLNNNTKSEIEPIENLRIIADKITYQKHESSKDSIPENDYFAVINNDNIISFVISGDSMINAGINSGDLLFAETGIELKSNDIIIVEVNGDTYVKRLKIDGQDIWLFSENPHYKPVKINSNMKINYKGRVKAGLRRY